MSGRKRSSILYCFANARPRSKGIHVPGNEFRLTSKNQRRGENKLTLVFSITTLHLLMYTLLHLAFEDASPARFVVVCDLQDVGSVDPVVGSASHAVVTFAVELVDWDLQDC